MTRRTSTILLLCLLSCAVLVLTPSAAAGGGCYAEGPTSSSRAEGDVTVPIVKCEFKSTVLYIEPGSTVTWVNQDPVPHSVTGPYRSIGGDKLLHDGDELSFRFDKAGVFPYYCVLHSGMAGAVVVGDADDLKAAAPLDADAIAVPQVDDAAPPGDAATDNTEETSSNAAPIAIGAGVVALLIAAVIALLRRKPALQA